MGPSSSQCSRNRPALADIVPLGSVFSGSGWAAPHYGDWPGHRCLQKSTGPEQGEALESHTTAPSIRGHLQVSIQSAALTASTVTVPKQQPHAHQVPERPEQEAETVITAQLTLLCPSSSPEALGGSCSFKSQKACRNFSPAAVECCAWEKKAESRTHWCSSVHDLLPPAETEHPGPAPARGTGNSNRGRGEILPAGAEQPSPQERHRGYFSTREPSIFCTLITFHLPWGKRSEH